MSTAHPDFRPLYAAHLATLEAAAAAALERGGFDHLVIAAGQPVGRFLDDQDYPFTVNPHFKHWLPVTDAPGSWLVITPGRRPKLVYLQPRDYWHVVPRAPAGYWVEHFDLALIHEAPAARAELPREAARCAVIGDVHAALDGFTPNNPQAVLQRLDWRRGGKTPYELALMRVANVIGAKAHRAAEAAFRAGKSEFDIHLAYLTAARQVESELPYGNIVALNRHAAVLHYMSFDHAPPARVHSFLIDAGASFHGYASDITRTYAGADEDGFGALIDAVDAAQQGFCARVRAGQSYAELHLHAHRVLAGVLKEHGIIRSSAESAVESGLSAAFFPHGLGHGIGAQVHEVGGFQAGPDGGRIERPAGHPYLRLTRPLEPGMVVTIEPGLYFIDLLLAQWKERPAGREIDWTRVEALRKYGGIRIEDDVVCTADEPENLTRDAFAALAA